MPKASYSVQVKAPVEVVWRLLVDKIEHPGTYVPGVTAVKILDRQPGFVVRQMTAGGVNVVERITAFALERILGKRGLVVGDGFGRLAGSLVEIAAQPQGDRIVRINRQRLIEVF